MMYQAVKVILALSPAVGCFFAVRGLLHYFQLESYQFHGYRRSIARNWKRSLTPGLVMTVLMLALFACHHTLSASAGQTAELFLSLVVLVLNGVGGIWCGKLFSDRKAKKPFHVTSRVKRLYAVFTLLMIAVGLACVYCTPFPLLLCFVPLLMPAWVALAGLIAWPIEKLISELYFQDAHSKLMSAKGLIRIGVTGSYGKTSVKFILGTLLSEKYNTLITPSSFNTPMGVTRVIREKLLPTHQVFVAEMGARHVGDIKELCRLVKPELGVLTSVGPQHLETFKTIERISATKYELMDAIPSNGHCFFADDKGICMKLYQQTQKPKTLVSLNRKEADLWADNVQVTSEGTSFVLHCGEQQARCATRLLGAHNIQNILLAASVCVYLNMSMTQIARGIRKLEPVEHRLQLIGGQGGVTIIDDAFNSNPSGASAALNVLKQFKGRRIVITPGMVELGDKEKELNFAFGQEMAGAADIAILVGKKRTAPIAAGLADRKFDASSLHVVQNLEESTKLLHSIMCDGDVVLYENDLPDNYSEM